MILRLAYQVLRSRVPKEVVKIFPRHLTFIANIKSVAITSDNRWAIAGTDDSSILIYDTQNPDLEPDVLENVHHRKKVIHSLII